MTKQKQYTVNLTITSSSFPNHPHLAVLVARRMWEMSHHPSSISSLSGIPTETIQRLSKLEQWTRLARNVWITGFHGPFLLPDETEELMNGTRFEDDPVAVSEREAEYKPMYYTSSSASSALSWL